MSFHFVLIKLEADSTLSEPEKFLKNLEKGGTFTFRKDR